MKNSTINMENKNELRSINFFIALTKFMIMLYTEKAIQICGLIISAFWCTFSYINDGNLIAAPFIVIGLFLFVKFLWIPNMNLAKNSKELQENLESLYTEKESLNK